MKRGLAILGVVLILSGFLVPVLIPPAVWGAIFGSYWLVAGLFVMYGLPVIGIILLIIATVVSRKGIKRDDGIGG